MLIAFIRSSSRIIIDVLVIDWQQTVVFSRESRDKLRDRAVRHFRESALWSIWVRAWESQAEIPTQVSTDNGWLMKFTRSKAVSFFEDSNIQAKNQLCGSRIIFCKIYDRRTGSLWPISQVGKWNFRLNLSVAMRPFHTVRPFSLTQSTVFFRLSSATNYRLSPLFWLQSDVNCLLVRVPLSLKIADELFYWEIHLSDSYFTEWGNFFERIETFDSKEVSGGKSLLLKGLLH